MIRLSLLTFLLSTFSPAPKQNIAITDEGQPVCGAVMLTNNLVLTAAHCVRSDGGAFSPYVDVRCGGVDSPAKVIKASMDEDLAVLRFVLPCTEGGLTAISYSNPPLGAQVHAYGYPGGSPRLSRGIVSAYETSELADDSPSGPPNSSSPNQSRRFAKHPVLISDTKIYFGNSGGGLFNANGELVGIASQLDSAGYGYWIPASSIHAFLDGI
jgi:S1-C subfamily serine protease